MKLGAGGTKVAYEDFAGNNNSTNTFADVYICDLDGSNRQRIPAKLKSTEEDGRVSPDGTKVLLHAFGSETAASTGATDIWVYNLITGTSTQMTTNAAYDAYPCWCADGTKIAFMSQRSHDDTTQSYQLWVINANEPENTTTNIPVQLTNFKGASASIQGIANRVAQYDSTHIIFIAQNVNDSYTIGSTTTYPYEIYTCEIQDTDGDKFGDHLTALTKVSQVLKTNNTPCTMYDPSLAMGRVFFWSDLCADGQWHMFSLDPSGVNKDIWQVTCAAWGEDYGFAEGSHLVYRINNNDLNSQGIGNGNTDVGIYDLVQDDGSLNGTINANILAQGWTTHVAGIQVNLYNGATLISSKTTDADGNVSFTGLRAGGYYLRFQNDAANTTQIPFSTVGRGCVVAPNGTTSVSAFTSPAAAPRPNGLMATIEGSQVLLQWQSNAESTNASTGFTYQGFNIFRSDSESGPYTKINAELVPKPTNGIYRWYDTSPADLTKSFYKVTAVTTSIATAPNGAQTLESTPSEFAQAANNLLYNASYELSDGTNNPAGWQKVLGTTGTDNGLGVDTSDFIIGAQSQYLSAGATKSGSVWAHSQIPTGSTYAFYCVPTEPRAAYVSGAYSRWTGVTKVSANNKSYTQLAYATTEPNAGIPFWYDATTNGTTIASPTGTATSTPWMWSYGTTTSKAYEFATYTRFSTCAAFDATTSVGTTARALFDDAHYQVKRVGATGIVWGRVVDSTLVGVSGVQVSDGTRITYTGPDGVFALRGVPTGNANISISYPGQTTITQTVSNIGGYRFPADVAYTSPIPFGGAGGRVLMSDGTPASGAAVRMLVGNLTLDGEETEYTATSDANGYFTFDTSSHPISTTLKAWVVASKAGYQSAYVSGKAFGASGVTRFALTLGSAVPVIEIAKTNVPPTIDGTVNVSEWQASSQTPLAYRYPGTFAPDVPTKAYALWDDSNLYIAMVATEPNIPGLVAGWTGSDLYGSGTSIWADDNIGMFLDPTNSTAIGYYRECWQLGVNSNQTAVGYADGTIRTGPASMTLRSADDISGLVVANHVDSANGNWSIEAQIPFSGMGGSTPITVVPPTVGTEWRGTFVRNRAQTGENSSSSAIPVAVAYAFSKAELWNTLRFVNTVTPPAVKGDLNGDGQVTNADAIIALQIAGGLQTLAGRVTQGDVVTDGKVDLLDASRILRKVHGLEPAW